MEPQEIRKLIKSDNVKDAIAETIKLTENLSPSLSTSAVLLNSRYEDFQNDEIDGTSAGNSEINSIKRSVLMLLLKIEECTNNKGEIISDTQDTLLSDCSFPFVDRLAFRNILKTALQTNGAKMIFVKGDPKSGMSYLEKYLIHLGQKNSLYQIVPIEIPYYLDDSNPFKGVRLAKYISEFIGLKIKLNDSEEDQFKFVRFTTKLRENLSTQTKIPIFFLHDFHRMAIIPDDLIKFIFSIALTIRNNFPKSIFIIAGLNCELLPNWHTDLKQVYPVYSIENIDEQSIRSCLNSIFEKFQTKIFQTGNGQITKDEYIEGMIFRLIPDKLKIDVTSVGSKISEHLYILKNS